MKKGIMILGFIIWSIVTVIFLGIGISCRKSREAVGFFTGCKPPVIENVEQYNKAVSQLWFVSAGVYEIMGVPLLFSEQNSLLFVPIIFGVVLGFIVMMVLYLRIEAKYKKRS